MNKLDDKLNNIDNIIKQIKKNDYLQIQDKGVNLKNIIEMNKKDKANLDVKLNTIEKFSTLLENIIINNPNPDSLDTRLVDYLSYDDYYVK